MCDIHITTTVIIAVEGVIKIYLKKKKKPTDRFFSVEGSRYKSLSILKKEKETKQK